LSRRLHDRRFSRDGIGRPSTRCTSERRNGRSDQSKRGSFTRPHKKYPSDDLEQAKDAALEILWSLESADWEVDDARAGEAYVSSVEEVD
jgi:hypothetical protein